MEKYVSYYSAAKYWNIPCIETVIGKKATETNPADVTVFKHDARFRIKGKMVRSCEIVLPDSAFIRRNGKMVASPELLFLELASVLSIHRTILLGLQLCSHHNGHPSEAISTKQKLQVFLEKTKGHRGQRKAERALKYVENGSASIMESLVYMIFTLPNALGGYGLNHAIFNYKIELNKEVIKRLGKKYCFVDLYYKQSKIAVEYDSFAYHNSPSKQGEDLVRSATLERQGIKVMHLSTIQLYDVDACRDFAYNLATSIEKQIYIRTKKFDEMHALLRTLLPNEKTAD